MGKPQRGTPWYQRPLGVGLIGLMLMIGGWKLSTFVPPRMSDRGQQEQLEGLRRMSEDQELNERLDRIATNVRREPPYQFPGRLVFLAGMVVFAVGAIQMARSPSTTEEVEEEQATVP